MLEILIVAGAVLIALFMVLRAPWDQIDLDAEVGFRKGTHLKVKLRKPARPAPSPPRSSRSRQRRPDSRAS